MSDKIPWKVDEFMQGFHYGKYYVVRHALPNKYMLINRVYREKGKLIYEPTEHRVISNYDFKPEIVEIGDIMFFSPDKSASLFKAIDVARYWDLKKVKNIEKRAKNLVIKS